MTLRYCIVGPVDGSNRAYVHARSNSLDRIRSIARRMREERRAPGYTPYLRVIEYPTTRLDPWIWGDVAEARASL